MRVCYGRLHQHSQKPRKEEAFARLHWPSKLACFAVLQVHQPRLFIWNLFQKAMLLSEGRVLYYGLATQVG